MARPRRKWHSDFAQNLLASQSASTVERAVERTVEGRLSSMGTVAPPINLEIVASVCGISPPFERVPMKQDARLVFRDGKYYIQLNDMQSDGRHRFSSAHEISHKIFADVLGESNVSYSCLGVGGYIEDREEEWLCDYGAKHILLLTAKYLYPFIREHGGFLAGATEVEEQFEVSFEAAVRSLVEASSESVAVVFLGMGLRKEEETQQQQLSLFPEEITPPEEKLRIRRSYVSGTFPLFLPPNKSFDRTSCVYKTYESTDFQMGAEMLILKNNYRIQIEAVSRTIYHEGESELGVVAILRNPVEVS